MWIFNRSVFLNVYVGIVPKINRLSVGRTTVVSTKALTNVAVCAVLHVSSIIRYQVSSAWYLPATVTLIVAISGYAASVTQCNSFDKLTDVCHLISLIQSLLICQNPLCVNERLLLVQGVWKFSQTSFRNYYMGKNELKLPLKRPKWMASFRVCFGFPLANSYFWNGLSYKHTIDTMTTLPSSKLLRKLKKINSVVSKLRSFK